MNEMLLRGCTLKNTGYILGLAVYTGNETRIQKNSAKTPNKIGMFLDTPCLAMISSLYSPYAHLHIDCTPLCHIGKLLGKLAAASCPAGKVASCSPPTAVRCQMQMQL